MGKGVFGVEEIINTVTSYLDTKEEELKFLLSTLVNIDSGSYDCGGVSRVIQTLAVSLKEIGFKNELRKTTNTVNLVSRKSGSGQKTILLVGHADTVFEKGTVFNRPYKVDGDKILGPGVSDMKAGLVTIIYALKALENIKFTNYKEIVVVIGSDEEIGSPTSKQLYEQEAANADACFVFEPGRADGSLVSARKGVGSFKLSLIGRASHAGESPEKGASAIKELAHKILALEALNDVYKGVTVTIGVVSGGSRANIIPDKAEAEMDVRLPDINTAHEIIEKIKEITRTPVDSRVEVVLEGELNRPPMVKTEDTEQLLSIVKEAGAILDMDIKDIETGGASDGNFVAALGVPVVDGMGPTGGNYHRSDEFIFKDSLLQKTKLAALTLYKLGAK